MEKGDFYSSTGVEIEKIQVDGDGMSITIKVSGTTKFRTQFIGKAGYFYYGLSDNLKFKSLSFDINVNYYFYKFLGIGATYDYNKFELDGEISDLSGKVINKFGGFQVYLLIGF